MVAEDCNRRNRFSQRQRTRTCTSSSTAHVVDIQDTFPARSRQKMSPSLASIRHDSTLQRTFRAAPAKHSSAAWRLAQLSGSSSPKVGSTAGVCKGAPQTQHQPHSPHPRMGPHLTNCPDYSLTDCPSPTGKPLKVPAVGSLVCLLLSLPGSQGTLPLLITQVPVPQPGSPAACTPMYSPHPLTHVRMHTHRHTHTHTHTHTGMHAHTHTHTRTHMRAHTHTNTPQTSPLVLAGLLLCLPLPNHLQEGSLPALPLGQVAKGVHRPTQLCSSQLARLLAEDPRHSRGVVQVSREMVA